jgi:hypothetical protein
LRDVQLTKWSVSSPSSGLAVGCRRPRRM